MAELRQKIAHLQKLQATHLENIRHLEQQMANYGIPVPLSLQNAMTREQKELRKVEEKLRKVEKELRKVETEPPPTPREIVKVPDPSTEPEEVVEKKPTYQDSLPTWSWGVIALVAMLVGGAILLAVRGGGQSPPWSQDVLLARAVRTVSEIHVDGFLDEPAWSEGDSLTYAVHPAKNGSTTATVRFLWDDDYLYASFDVNDTQVEMADLSTLWDSDSVSLLLHDRGIAEHRQSLGERSNDDTAVQLKPMTTLNEPADTDAGYTVEMRIKWKEPPSLGRRIPADLLSVDHDANPGTKYDTPGTVFSKLSWDGDGSITSTGASLLLVDGKHSR